MPVSVVADSRMTISDQTEVKGCFRVPIATYRLTRRLSVLATLAFIPASLLDNKDVHHLRGDLSQDPSFSMVGYGVGADADVGARFMITTNFSANVGYRMYY